jgi:hypothetical protein
MTRTALRPLRLEVASPCTVPWQSMRGDDRVRHCDKCRLDVYDLSGMSQREAEALIESREGRLCVRFYRRPDGTVVTRDCGAAARRVARTMFAAICTFVALVLTGSAAGMSTWLTEVRWPGSLRGAPSRNLVMADVAVAPQRLTPTPVMGAPAPIEVKGEAVLMGRIATPRKGTRKVR